MSIQLPPNSTGTVVDTVTLASKDRELVVIAGDGAAAEVAGIALTSPTETEYALITRPIFRVDGETLSTTPLGISGVFTGAWQPANDDGVSYVEAAARSDVASAANGFIIQESDDSTDANFTRTVQQISVSAATTTFLYATIRGRFWRVQYTNGGTGQASFKLTAVSRQHQVNAVDASGNLIIADGGGSLTIDGSLTNISGTISLPTGASTSANQSTEITSLQLIDDTVYASDAAIDKVVGIGGQFDDTTPGTTTENSVRSLRMSTRRELYTQIRDAAGNERGANVSAGNALLVDASATTQPVSGTVAVSSITTSITPGTAAANLGKAEDAVAASGDTGIFVLAVANEANTARAADGDYIAIATDTEGNNRIVGNRDHDAVDAGEVVAVGGQAIAHGTNPTAVAAADRTRWYFNRAGVPFVIGGHPNIVTIRANYTAAQTDTALVTITTGLKIVVTRVMVTASNANSVNVSVVVGFGVTNTPTTTGVIAAHPNIAAGSGFVTGDGSGILGVGADNEDLRITSSVPTGGSIDVIASYYTIET